MRFHSGSRTLLDHPQTAATSDRFSGPCTDYTIQCLQVQHQTVPIVVLTRRVENDLSETRRKNLRAYCAKPGRNWDAGRLATELRYGRYTYWRDMLNGSKPFGERAARRFEDALGLSRGYLDVVDERPLSPRAIILGQDWDALPDGDLKEALYARMKKLLEDQLRPRIAAQEKPQLPVESKEDLQLHR